MTTQRWRDVERVFDAASALEPQERLRFLERECCADIELRREVESLLACDSEDDTFAEQAVQGTAALLAADVAEPMAGKRLGPYRITRLLGRGGMGAVYEATREDGEYEHRVAIKLVRHGIESVADIRRFRRERQTLSRLNHPYIARLLDGGATDEGLPFIVMEFVDGHPITEYCAQHDLSLEQTLRLFLLVASAVQYAHQSLVVHSDIKPGNVLVTRDGTPKLLDFGIARLIDPETGDSDRTYTTATRLTPEFASPEQVRGEPVTVASDVYSLGALLYALVAGAPPHPVSGRSQAQLEQAICESQPQLPSAASRRRELRGDLDNILLMALRKEPERRYASAEKLAEDIRRFLDGRPVVARHDTLLYRTSKYIRRNRIAVASAILVLAVAATGVTTTVQQSRRAERRYEQVRSLTQTLVFDLDDRITLLPGSLDSRKFLADTALKYYDSLAKDAEGDERLQWDLCRAYEKLGRIQSGNLPGFSGPPNMPGLAQPRQAAESFRKALALQQRLSTEHPDNADYSRILPVLYHHLGLLDADAQRSVKYIEQAFSAAEKAVQRRAMPQVPPRLWVALGLARMQAGDPKSAREAFSRSPALQARLFDLWARFLEGDIEGTLETGRSQLALGEQHLTQYQESTPAYRITMYGVAGQHIGRAIRLAHPLFPNLERRAEALRSAARAVRLAERLKSRDAADGTARELLNLAYRTDAALRWDSEPAIALEELRKAAEFGDVPRAEVARALRRLGRRDEAASELQAALREMPGHGNEAAMRPSTGMSVLFYGSEADASVFARQEMAQLRLDTGDADGALPFLNQAVDMTERLVGARPYMTPLRARLAQCYQDLGKWYESADQPSQALGWHNKSLSVWREWTKWGAANQFQQRRQREAEASVQRLGRTAVSATARR